MSNLISGLGAPTAPPRAGNGAADAVVETTTQTFARDVIQASQQQPVLVDFWAPWCGPCRQLAPVLEKVVRATRGAVKLVKMNIDDHPAIAGQLGIQSIPAVIAFVKGQPVDGFLGAVPESQVQAFIDRLGATPPSSGVDDILAEAEALLAAGDAAGAGELFAAVLEAASDDLRAIGGLARAAIAAGDLEAARQALAMVPEAKAGDAALSAARAALALAEQTVGLGNAAELQARIAANPADHEARFDLALHANAAGDREAAAEHLLEIVRRQRKWEDEKARKQLVQFFELWGPTDPATLSARRRLSSLLFS